MNEFLNLIENSQSVLIFLLLLVALYFSIIIGNKYAGAKNEINMKKKTLIKTIIGIILLVMTYRLVTDEGMFRTMVFTVIAAGILAYFLNPLVDKLERKKIKRSFGILIIYLGIVLIITTMIMTIAPRIASELAVLINNLPKYVNQIYYKIADLYEYISTELTRLPFDITSILDEVSKGFNDMGQVFKNYIIGSIGFFESFFSKAFNVVLIPVMTFYFLKDKKKIQKNVVKVLPKKHRRDINELLKEVDKKLGGYIRGQLLVCVFIGIATSIALGILDIDFALTIGLFAGIFNIIPYLGPIMGLIPAVIFAALDDPIKIIWVVIAITVIQQLESNFISPKIVGDSVGLPPIVVMISVILGGAYFGMAGMLFAVPATASAVVIIKFAIKKINSIDEDKVFEKDKGNKIIK